jgi:hypothetical protein
MRTHVTLIQSAQPQFNDRTRDNQKQNNDGERLYQRHGYR